MLDMIIDLFAQTSHLRKSSPEYLVLFSKLRSCIQSRNQRDLNISKHLSSKSPSIDNCITEMEPTPMEDCIKDNSSTPGSQSQNTILDSFMDHSQNLETQRTQFLAKAEPSITSFGQGGLEHTIYNQNEAITPKKEEARQYQHYKQQSKNQSIKNNGRPFFHKKGTENKMKTQNKVLHDKENHSRLSNTQQSIPRFSQQSNQEASYCNIIDKEDEECPSVSPSSNNTSFRIHTLDNLIKASFVDTDRPDTVVADHIFKPTFQNSKIRASSIMMDLSSHYDINEQERTPFQRIDKKKSSQKSKIYNPFRFLKKNINYQADDSDSEERLEEDGYSQNEDNNQRRVLNFSNQNHYESSLLNTSIRNKTKFKFKDIQKVEAAKQRNSPLTFRNRRDKATYLDKYSSKKKNRLVQKRQKDKPKAYQTFSKYSPVFVNAYCQGHIQTSPNKSFRSHTPSRSHSRNRKHSHILNQSSRSRFRSKLGQIIDKRYKDCSGFKTLDNRRNGIVTKTTKSPRKSFSRVFNTPRSKYTPSRKDARSFCNLRRGSMTYTKGQSQRSWKRGTYDYSCGKNDELQVQITIKTRNGDSSREYHPYNDYSKDPYHHMASTSHKRTHSRRTPSQKSSPRLQEYGITSRKFSRTQTLDNHQETGRNQEDSNIDQLQKSINKQFQDLERSFSQTSQRNTVKSFVVK